MVYEVKFNKTDIQKPQWITDMGNHNKLPTPYREISWHEFFSRWTYNIEFIDFRQINIDGVRNVHILWFFNEALAIAKPTKWKCGADEFKRDGIIYDDKPRFFHIGCDHDFEHYSPYMFEHHYTCKKCGHKEVQDSSG